MYAILYGAVHYAVPSNTLCGNTYISTNEQSGIDITSFLHARNHYNSVNTYFNQSSFTSPPKDVGNPFQVKECINFAESDS